MERVGRYELIRELGQGGTGTVWEAVLRGPGLQVPVAVKVLRDGAGELRREARIGGLLRHRHLVDVYEVGEQDGRWFCALELCAGGSLASRGPLPPRAVVEVGLQVCEALRYAHEELGLVHLDLKPANLLLHGGDVKVADLGTARARGFGGDGKIRGTPGYMAPEQARGEPVDARADVFALGVTLVELATGAPPGASGTVDLTDDDPSGTLAFETPAPAPDRGDGVPWWLAPVVHRCLEPRRDDRWPDFAAVAEALKGLRVEGPGLREALGLGSADAPRADTSPPPDAFIGRDDELAALDALLDAPGVVHLRGPVGIGKSRLAGEAARLWRATTGRPTWRCDATEVRTLDGLLDVVASALDVPLVGAVDVQAALLGDALAARGDALLVVDGLDAGAELAPVLARWRARAPGSRLLVTARATLPIDAIPFPVAPLPPDDAAALLVARALQRGARVADDPALPELAARLDGVPLALELAAGRLGVLSVADVLERLSLSLLRRASDDRRGALHAALDAGWEGLCEAERSALAQLSVFAGGFTIEAAEQVLSLDVAALDVLGSLADRSWVSPAGAGRLALLAAIREYAAERLAEDPGPAARHTRWCVTLATGAPGSDPRARRRRLALELDNLVAACRRAIAGADGPSAAVLAAAALEVVEFRASHEVAIRLARSALDVATRDEDTASLHGTLARALSASGRSREAFPHAELAAGAAFASAEPVAVARARLSLGTLCVDVGRLDEARGHLLASAEAARALGERELRGYTLKTLGDLCAMQGRDDEAHAALDEALALWRAIGDSRAVAGVLISLGHLRQRESRLDEARDLFEEALDVHRADRNRAGEGTALASLGRLLRSMRRADGALAYLHDAQRLLREVGRRSTEGSVAINLGCLYADLGHLPEARAHLEEAVDIARETGIRRSEATARANLGRVLADLGHADEGRAELEAARGIYADLRLREAEVATLCELAAIELERDRPDDALACCEAALPMARDVGASAEGVVHLDLGRVHLALGRPDQARASFEAALSDAVQRGDARRTRAALGRLGAIDLDEGHLADARARLEEARSLHASDDQPALGVAVLAHLARLAAAEGDLTAAREALALAEASVPHPTRDARHALELARQAVEGLSGGGPLGR